MLGLLGLSGLLGLMAKVLGAIVEIATPILKAIVDGIIWIWQKILWPGIVDILDTWATVLTVGAMMAGLFLYIRVNDDIRYNNQTRQLNACHGELKKLKRRTPSTPQTPLWEFKWPSF